MSHSTPTESRANWSLASPSHAAGAIGIIDVCGDVSWALERCGLPELSPGDVKLRDLLGIDRGLVIRWTDSFAQLMPHGGLAVLRGIGAELTARGIVAAAPDAPGVHPHALDAIESHMLDALAMAPSPRAIDLLLEQPERWRRLAADSPRHGAGMTALDVVRRRLLHPPLVVVVGPPNIGKSTLLNCLAQRPVAIVADVAGTTRDHIGVLLEVDGLAIRYVDTPGMRETGDEIEAAAIALAREVSRSADLIIRVGDRTHGPLSLEALGIGHVPAVTIALRADLGIGEPGFAAALALGRLHEARQSPGLLELGRLIRRELVSDNALTNEEPWRFF